MEFSSYSLYSKKKKYFYFYPRIIKKSCITEWSSINRNKCHFFTYSKKKNKRNLFRIGTGTGCERVTTVTKVFDTGVKLFDAGTFQAALSLERDKHVTDVEIKATKGEASLETLLGASKRSGDSDCPSEA